MTDRERYEAVRDQARRLISCMVCGHQIYSHDPKIAEEVDALLATLASTEGFALEGVRLTHGA